MAPVVSILHYKYGHMTIEQLLDEAESHAKLLERGSLTAIEKYRSRCVFIATKQKASSQEVKDLMQLLLRMINYF